MSIVFKYSAKLMACLEEISKDIFSFLEFVSGEKIDESRRRLMEEDFEYESLLLDI